MSKVQINTSRRKSYEQRAGMNDRVAVEPSELLALRSPSAVKYCLAECFLLPANASGTLYSKPQFG